MKYAKMLGLLAMAAAALMAFAGSASASGGTTATTNAAGHQVTVGDTLHAESVGSTTLDGTVNITCKKSTVHGEVEKAGSSTETLAVTLTTLNFEECGNNTVTVVQPGTLEVHTDPNSTTVADGNGTLTSKNAIVTVLTHNILGTVHCIYVTGNGTDVGTIDGSRNTGGHATLTVGSAAIPRETTDFGCGSTSEWTGHYTITAPAYLDID